MRINWKLLSAAVFFVLSIASCKKEDNKEEENDNELITTIEVKATERGTSNVSTFTWSDVDGTGGNAPVIDPIILQAGKIYDVELSVMDESKNPAEDITAEISEEAEAHRFYFIAAPSNLVTVAGFDKDADNVSLGVNSEWTTASAGSGTMTVVLRHYPNGGKEESDPVTSTKSSADAEVVFDLTIQAP